MQHPQPQANEGVVYSGDIQDAPARGDTDISAGQNKYVKNGEATQNQWAIPPSFDIPPAIPAAAPTPAIALPSVPYTAGAGDDLNNDIGKTTTQINEQDVERADAKRVPFWRGKSGSHQKGRGCAIFVLIAIVLGLAAFGAAIFGISVALEKGLTGEYFWTPGHKELFRVCESSSTSSKPFQAHTCNVFRPLHDMNSPPLHSFVESVRSWTSSHKASGQAKRVDPSRLDALLLNYGIRCSKIAGTVSDPTRQAQLVVGGVGQGFSTHKSAIACNYRSDGTNVQDHCGRYNDGGLLSPGKKHPLGINAIMTKHFNMTCEWVA